MKVTTLACIQGAWLPGFSPKRVLDIGAGTGLLSLMAAQQYDADIDAIEIELDAFGQLRENSAQSPWNERITCHHDDIVNFARNSNISYDFIISNPPFYSDQLKSSNKKINHARHETGLTHEKLIDVCSHLISGHGKISILLPPVETIKLAEYCTRKSLYISDQLFISDTDKSDVRGIVTILSKKPSILKVKYLTIKKDNKAYTSGFISLLNRFYLYL